MSKPKIAMIAIHGVGDHKQGATSAQVAAQLQHFYPGEFPTFECAPLQIAVDTTWLQPEETPPPAHNHHVPDSVRARALSATPQEADETADVAFTAVTLSEDPDGTPYTASYDTTRLRCADRIDLYEMYWSDLSHGGTTGGLAVVRQLMQLLLHVACLGRTALGTLVAARGEVTCVSGPVGACNAASWGYWLLAVPIALGNLLLACFGAAFLGQLLPDTQATRTGVAIGGTLLAMTLLSAAWRMLMRREQPPRMLERLGVPAIWLAAVPLAVLGAIWYATSSVPPADAAFVLALATALVAGTVVARFYQVSRPTVMVWWWLLLAFCVLWAIGGARYIAINHEPLNCRQILAYLVEACFCWLVAAWALLSLANLWLLATGLLARVVQRGDDAVKRSVNTAFVAAAVPASLLLIVVLTLWLAFSHWLGTHGLGGMDRPVHLFMFGWLKVAGLIGKLIALSASPAAIPFLLCLAVVFVWLAAAILPSALAELFPPTTSRDAETWAARACSLWRWLNGGFGLLACGAFVAVVAFFFLLPAGALWQYVPDHVHDQFHTLLDAVPQGIALPAFDPESVGLTLGAGALTFLSVTRVFGAISIGKVARTFARMRVVVDTAIDVDNWLRERPVGRTPRLRIMARYASLLRHLREQGYRRIIVVGHSQGTVITADFLRYLKVRNAGVLPAIDLLTFGSPLRQLYAARFPALYGWIEEQPYDKALDDMAVLSWKNGYGSGDYVGRNLWPDARGPRPCQPGPLPAQAPERAEFCTGPLAHTHYFDACSPGVAAAILHAIQDAEASLQPSDVARQA